MSAPTTGNAPALESRAGEIIGGMCRQILTPTRAHESAKRHAVYCAQADTSTMTAGAAMQNRPASACRQTLLIIYRPILQQQALSRGAFTILTMYSWMFRQAN